MRCSNVYLHTNDASCTRLLLSGSGHTMTNDERDALDSEIQLFLRTCADRVRRVQKWCSKCDNDGMIDIM